jgi:hypothetical protein
MILSGAISFSPSHGSESDQSASEGRILLLHNAERPGEGKPHIIVYFGILLPNGIIIDSIVANAESAGSFHPCQKIIFPFLFLNPL